MTKIHNYLSKQKKKVDATSRPSTFQADSGQRMLFYRDGNDFFSSYGYVCMGPRT